ncbi:hypothetical protein JTB14_004143 [Gonioctena quinquepunctata]|nr:hypothetical protein JTB14_004143 [Gonioctena quinquepunctata]
MNGNRRNGYGRSRNRANNTNDRGYGRDNSQTRDGGGANHSNGRGQRRDNGQNQNWRDNNDNNANRRRNDGNGNRSGNNRRNMDRNTNPGNNSGQRNNWVVRKMGFKLAEELGDNENTEKVIQDLLNDRVGFKKLLEDNELSGDFLVLIVHILSTVSESSFTHSKMQIYQTVFSNSTYVKQLKAFITSLPFCDESEKRLNKYFWTDSDKFWYNLIDVFKDLTTTPSYASQILPTLLKSIVVTLPILEANQNIHISEEIKDGFGMLQNKIQNMKSDMKERFHSKTPQVSYNQATEDDWVPPKDFRTINVYPDILEVATNQKPFLRRNKTLGPYRNVEHYLDVQFRLLREDFVAPLRKGICQYLDNPNLKRYDDIKIHPKVHFLCEENINQLKCFKIQFDFSEKKRSLKLENTKQFMFGSLVCFSNDRFVSIKFAKIVKRDPDMIKKGELIVGFDSNKNVAVTYKRDYVMVESKVYFEPYFHVLTALQKMTEDNFPLQEYIVKSASNMYYPEYLDEDTVFEIDGLRIAPMAWHSNHQLYGLNQSQEHALRTALTREVSVIQGPPGTGKTFLGLKIAHTLLNNKQYWYKHTPLLVICYTNHALDQFLEGILGSTKNILRIGGQSKNENLQNFNLRNRKQNTRKSAAFYQSQRELTLCLNDLKAIDSAINRIKQYNSVLDFSCFDGVVEDFRGTWFQTASSENIKQWLLPNVNAQVKASVPRGPPIVDNWAPDSASDDEFSEYSEDEEEEVDEIFRKLTISGPSDGSKKTFSLQTLQRLETVKNGVTSARRSILRKQPFQMNLDERWWVYSFFLGQYLSEFMSEREEVNKLYQEKYNIYTEQRDMEDVKVMKESLVIGMTTTSAARLRPVLEALKSPIVIVEEAAEVLETHIISALTVHCEQLIMIGDHQQLRPSTADYIVETEYQMGVSLFERMVRNNVQRNTLTVQHRMRPEICDLIRPSIYPDLEDHSTVSDRPKILGVDKFLYFITHNVEEKACGDSSKKNLHEVTFLINLARYLVLNGHKPQSITILAAYLGQMFEMQREKKKYSLILKDVRVSVLDNYQGEENDIILLSLVRNNKESNNGFLKTTNRVCVALSRARNGLYIMGNMSQLCRDNNTIWLKIREKLESQGAVGPFLELRCQIHDVITKVKSEEDFNKIPEGGCTRTCGAKLTCGHSCKNVCHLDNRDHKHYTCIEKCGRRLCTRYESHICERPCYEKCPPCHFPVRWRLPCGHKITLKCHLDPLKYNCIEEVLTQLPCGHEENKPCYMKPEEFDCPRPCDALLDCGHACTLSCHDRKDPDHLEYECPKPCERMRNKCSLNTHKCRKLCHEECEPCKIKVKKRRTLCTHVFYISCDEDVNTKKCTKPCERKLPCGHGCENGCSDDCGPCMTIVGKVVPSCGHEARMQCCKEPERKRCKDNCNRKLVCGHSCTNKCRDECTSVCEALKTCNLPSLCGHTVKQIKCYERLSANDKILLTYCTEPCRKKLACGHMCTGTCGQCFQGRIHARCREKCGVPLVCNHECPIPCREACKPCGKKCSYKCEHGRCTKKCGEVCVKCMEKCPRQCIHQRCGARCGDICDVEPCRKPCPKSLRCGHACVGFCNEPCPKLCRICHKEELLEVFFGTEEEDDARFVELQDCGHVLESGGMECWLESDNGEIQTKVCPKCKAPIINTQRYGEFVKRALRDIQAVKLKLNGAPAENNATRIDLLAKITGFKQKAARFTYLPKLSFVIQKLELRLQETKADSVRGRVRQTFNAISLKCLTSKVQILQHITDICLSRTQMDMSKEIQAQVNFLLEPLTRDADQITIQEIEDVQLEISRLTRMVELYQIRKITPTRTFFFMSYNRVGGKLGDIEKLVFSLKRYSEALDKEVESQLKKLNCGMQISESERVEIVKAMGLSKGHWFKCPNGHPYVITECGGAMQEFRCPDCGEKIGGTQHTLLATNQLAGEMDGAQNAAWSDVANEMGNWDL